MERFLIYIIISSLVTLVSVVFAYKPEEDELKLIDYNKNSIEGGQIESAPVYSDKPLKTSNQSTIGNSLEATLS